MSLQCLSSGKYAAPSVLDTVGGSQVPELRAAGLVQRHAAAPVAPAAGLLQGY